MRRWLAALLPLLLLFAPVSRAAEAGPVALPALSARVTDLTGTLSAAQQSTLEADLAGIEGRTGAQAAVLLLPTTGPESIEQFGIRLAEAWKIGHRGKDDGVILIVAKADHQVRIEVGYGLEGVLNDAACARLIREQILPRFKENDYYGGLQAAVAGLSAAIGSETPPPLTDGAMQQDAGPVELDRLDRFTGWVDDFSSRHEDMFWWLLVAIVVAVTALRLYFGDFLGSAVVGGLVGIAAFFLTQSLMAALIALAVGFLVALVGVNFLWSAVLSGGSGRSGGGFGGGGFSGGGGGFGGGGSSGSW